MVTLLLLVLACTLAPTQPCVPTFRTILSTSVSLLPALGMLIGEFNETLIPSDQRGGIFQHTIVALFANFMDQCNLLDLTTTGGRFTWHRNHNGNRILSKKLDRGLANVEWCLAFPKILSRFSVDHSDHNPLLLHFGGLPIVTGPKPFRFEAAWIDHGDYSTLVERAWTSNGVNALLRKLPFPLKGESSSRRELCCPPCSF
jgi:hypothetical protein